MHLKPETIRATCTKLPGNYDISNSSLAILQRVPDQPFAVPEFWTVNQSTGKVSFCIPFSNGLSPEPRCVEAQLSP